MFVLATNASTQRTTDLHFYQSAFSGSQTTWNADLTSPPAFSITPHGICARLPVMEMSYKGITFYLAFLFCTQVINDDRKHLALILLRCPDNVNSIAPIYHCTCISNRSIRLVALSEDTLHSSPWPRSWTMLHVSAKPPFRADTAPPPSSDLLLYRTLRFTNITNTVPFRVPPEAQKVDGHVCSGFLAATITIQDGGWTGTSPLTLFYHKESYVGSFPAFAVCLGVCTDTLGAQHWAHVHGTTLGDEMEVVRRHGVYGNHICAQDHVSAWPRASRKFDASWRQVTLTFTVCPMNETGRTLVMHLRCD